MGARITVGVRSLVLAAATAAAVLVAYVAGNGSGGATAAPAASDRRTIVMTGTGEATAVPDQLTFRFTVDRKADDVSVALAAANASMRRVLAALEAEGVAKKDVQTTGLSVRPDYDYGSSGPPVLTGYVVRESASVLVRELRGSGKALTAAARAGGNAVRLHGLALRIGDRDALMSRARDAAVAEARAKAEQYAEATGQVLGPVVSLEEVRAAPAPTYALRAGTVTLDAAAGKVPIRAGSKDLKVTVAIVWQFA